MKVMVPLTDGFEEIEALTIIDVLRRAGLDVDTVGVVGTVIKGSHGVRTLVDKRLMEINPDSYDAIVIPGGPGYKNLVRSNKILEILRDFHNKEKIIGAICAAPLVLAKAGILENRRATVYPGMEKKIPYPRGSKVVVDQNIITSQGPGTALDFSLFLVKKLCGSSVEVGLRRELVVE